MKLTKISHLKLNARFSIFILITLLISFTIFGYFIYTSQKKILENKATEMLKSQMDDLLTIITLQNQIDSLEKENLLRISPGTLLHYIKANASDSLSGGYITASDVTLLINKSKTSVAGRKAIFRNIIYQKRYFKDGVAFCLGMDGKIVLHPFSEMEGKSLADNELFQMISTGKLNPLKYKVSNETETTKYWGYYTFYAPYNWYIIISVEEGTLIGNALSRLKLIIILITLFASLIFFISINLLLKRFIAKPLSNIGVEVGKLSEGLLIDTISIFRHDEIGYITEKINALVLGLNKTSEFANNIGQGTLDTEFTPLSDKDVLGNSLLNMRESLKKANNDEQLRKIEDEKRNWAAQGLAKFGDILRQNNDKLDVLAFNVIKNLVEYLKINQGGLFILNDDNEDHQYLELLATYAYDRKKYLEKRIEIGEGLVGSCFKEQSKIYLKQVPDDYIHISSGLGEDPPSELLLVPLKLNDDVFGVLELSSFKSFEEFEIEFIERVGESIASTISTVKINLRTSELLQKSQQQAEEMRAQEEEMRQNMEELTATQEALAEKDRENQDKIRKLNEEHIKTLEDLKEKETQHRAILNNSQDGIIIVDKYGTIDYYSKSCERIFLYAPHEIIGKNVKTLMPEEFAENHDEYIQEFIQTGEKKVIDKERQFPLKTKHGEIKEGIISLSVSSIKNDFYFTAFIKDLSVLGEDRENLMKKEKQLKKCEQDIELLDEQFKNTVTKYSSIVDTYRNAFHIELDGGFKIVNIHDRLLKKLQVPDKKDLIDKDFEILLAENYVKSSDFEHLKNKIAEFHTIEALIPLKITKRESFQVKANITKLENPIDESISYLMVITDVSDFHIEQMIDDFPKPTPTAPHSKENDNEIITQLEDELAKALEEIDELKARIAKKS